MKLAGEMRKKYSECIPTISGKEERDARP